VVNTTGHLISLDTVSHIRWYIFLRWFLLVALIVPGLASMFADEGFSTQVIRDGALAAFSFLANGIFYVLVYRPGRSYRYYEWLARIVIATDLAIITFFIYGKGGIESRSVLLYVIPILMSALLFKRGGIYKTALTALVCYNGLIVADYLGWINTLGSLVPSLHASGGYVLNSVLFLSSAILIITFVGDFMSRLLMRQKQLALKNLTALERAQAIARLGSWEHSTATGQTIWSAEMYTLFGYDPADGTRKIQDIINAKVHPDDKMMLQRKLDRALKRKSSYSMDFRTIEGSMIKYFHSEARSITNHEGRVTDVFGTMHDVTDAKTLEEAKGDFVSLASHQLRTPATIVKQYLLLLMDGYAGEMTDEQRQFITNAFESNERQIKIINDLLGVVQLEAGRFKLRKTKTDLVQLTREAVSLRQKTAQTTRHHLRFRQRRQKLVCTVDAEQLKIAIENVIENAVKYSPSGTNIIVSVLQSGRYAKITVKDHGIGIAKEDIPHMFEKFIRIDNEISVKAGGSGLGLFWVAKIIDLHKGRIEVASRPGEGTMFTLLLPLR
jgi:PAS domain-containing protein/anti-sigma regulatory factor (Ser/Thr protein kinase)